MGSRAMTLSDILASSSFLSFSFLLLSSPSLSLPSRSSCYIVSFSLTASCQCRFFLCSLFPFPLTASLSYFPFLSFLLSLFDFLVFIFMFFRCPSKEYDCNDKELVLFTCFTSASLSWPTGQGWSRVMRGKQQRFLMARRKENALNTLILQGDTQEMEREVSRMWIHERLHYTDEGDPAAAWRGRSTDSRGPLGGAGGGWRWACAVRLFLYTKYQ